MIKIAILIQKVNKSTGKKEYALVSIKDRSKVLRWFGVKRPSEERLEKEEKRINFFKNVKKAVLAKLK